MPDCLFCKIITSDIPCHKIYEDDRVVAFLDIHPVAPGHTLVVPRAHANNLEGSAADDLAAVLLAVGKLMPALRSVTNVEGFNVTSNVGAPAGQSVFHTHFHLIPRETGDGLALWPHLDLPQEELAALAQQLRAAI